MIKQRWRCILDTVLCGTGYIVLLSILNKSNTTISWYLLALLIYTYAVYYYKHNNIIRLIFSALMPISIILTVCDIGNKGIIVCLNIVVLCLNFIPFEDIYLRLKNKRE